MKKKTYLSVLALACIFGLAACGGSTTSEKAAETTAEETQAADPAGLGNPVPAADSFAGGSGTEEDPYRIATAGQLALLAEKVNEGDKAYREASYVLTEDIELNDTSDLDTWGETAPEYQWTPIGNESSFYGSFDGGGHSISGLYCYMKDLYVTDEGYHSDVLGLFGMLRDAQVKNLTVKDSWLESEGQIAGCGAIAAEANNSQLENCVNEATVIFRSTGGGAVGGVVGTASGSTLADCTNRGTVRHVGDGRNDEVEKCGGVAGLIFSGMVTGCVNEGEITGLGTAGGVFGGLNFTEKGESCEVKDCSNTGTVVGADQFTGGIIGDVYNGYGELSIENCVNSGSVTAQGSVGGLFGKLRAAQLPNKEDYAGVLTVSGCRNEGEVILLAGSISGQAGGIAGDFGASDGGALTVKSCENTGTVTAEDHTAGGLFGTVLLNYQGTMEAEACVNRGSVTTANGCGGGIAAMLTLTNDNKGERHIRFTDCVNEGEVHGSGYGVGGILGMTTLLSLDADSFEVVRCDNRGEIRGEAENSAQVVLGGIIGEMITTDGTLAVTDCTNSGNIVLQAVGTEAGERPSLTSIAAGIVASYAENVQITGCESTGTISAEGVSEEVSAEWVKKLEENYPNGYIKGVHSMDEIKANVEAEEKK